MLRPGSRRAARVVALAAAVVLLSTASSALARWSTIERPRLAVLVAAADVAVRGEPSPTGTTLFTARPGTVLRIERARDAWAQVASRDGRRGWVPLADVVSIASGAG